MRSLILFLTLFAGMLLSRAVFLSVANNQDNIPRPEIYDKGEVKETRRSPGSVSAKITGRKASSAANGVLIVLTAPDNAEVAVDGKPLGHALKGTFEKELPLGKQYNVVVSAGPDFEPYKQTVALKRGKTEIVRAALTSKYGVIKVFPAMTGVRMLVDGKPAAPDSLSVDKDNNIVLQSLSPGEHEVTYDHPDYVIYKRKFTVSPGSEFAWRFIPALARSEITVVSDPNAKVYIDGAPVGETPADGILKIPDVRIGPHAVKLVKDDYEEFTAACVLEFGKPVRVEKKLVPLPTSAEFGDDFDVPSAARWTAPKSGWEFKSGRLHLDNAPVIGFPKNIRYRDFTMHFHLKLTDAGGAAWAVRVKDPNNYYLFYLSGPKGLFPKRFNVYIVRDNKLDLSQPDGSVFMLTEIKAGGQYEIDIQAKGKTFEHEIKPADTGKSEVLGFFEDKDNLFPYGGVGFRTVAAEKFSIDDLFVRPR